MFLPFEVLVIICCCAIGLRREDVGKIFVILVASFLLVFRMTMGNPLALLVSGGGWLILDGMLITAALIAYGIVLLRR